MIKTNPIPDRSRLEQLFTSWSLNKVRSSEQNLGEQLGRLISVSQSLTLTSVLGQLPNKLSGCMVDSSALREDVMTSREYMIQVITQSFVSDDQIKRVKVPSDWVNVSTEDLLSYHPYQRFYSMHQTEMASGIQALRQRVRLGLGGFSVELHQLAELDRIMAESLADQTNSLYKVCPKLLERHFKQMLPQHFDGDFDQASDGLADWLAPGGWLELFYLDLRELLLAELDVRLQPVLGLLEALNEHVTNTNIRLS